MTNKTNNSFGLWKKTSKSGLTYLNGTLTVDGKEYYMSVFKNANKTTDRHPDWNLVLTPKDEDGYNDTNTNLDDEVDF